jgi:hypothetical protein
METFIAIQLAENMNIHAAKVKISPGHTMGGQLGGNVNFHNFRVYPQFRRKVVYTFAPDAISGLAKSRSDA